MESSPLRVNESTELIEISKGKFKFINCLFEKSGHKMYDFQCDIKLRANGKVYQAHRDVLSKQSGYFEAMFRANFREKDQEVIELHDLPPMGFESLLEYFYRGHITITNDNIGEVVEAARFFQNDWLLSACMIFLVNYFIFGDDEKALELAETYELGDLWGPAFSFIGTNFGSFVERESLNRIGLKVLLKFLREDNFIDVTESALLQSLTKFWGDDHDSLMQLLGVLRLKLLNYKDLQLIQSIATGCELKLGEGDCLQRQMESEKNNNKNEKEIDPVEELIQNLRALNCGTDNEETMSDRPRGARPALLIFSTVEHHTIFQCVRVDSAQLAMFIEMNTEDFLPVSPEDACVAPLGPHVMLLCGGYDFTFESSDASLTFNPSTLTWSQLPSMKNGRVSHAVASTESRQGPVVAAVGGVCRSSDLTARKDSEKILSSVELLEKNNWRELPSMPSGLFCHAAAFLDDDLYVSGGISDDPLDPIPLGRVFKLRLGSGYVDSEEEESEYWETLAEMNCPRQQHVMFGYDGRIFVFGGTTVPLGEPEEEMFGEPVACLVNEVYTPELDVWTEIPATPVEYGRIFSPSAVVGDFVYLCSGDQENKYLRTFNLKTCEWSSKDVDDAEQRIGDVCTHLVFLDVSVRD